MELKLDTHVHSIASGHAFNTVNEIMAFANSKNMNLVCITDHGPSMKGAPHAEYFGMVCEVPTRFDNSICLVGCECNVVDYEGHLDLEANFLRNLDIVLIGLHELTPYPVASTVEANTTALINGMKNPFVNVVVHPYRKSFPVDIGMIVEAAANYNCMLEINCRVFRNATDTEHLTRIYSDMLTQCAERGVRVVIGTDAHVFSQVGDASPLTGFVESIVAIHDGIIVNDEKTLAELLLRKGNRARVKEIVSNHAFLYQENH